MKFKKTILFIHRWLGFISGLVVFIVSITGCVFCFQDEIQDAVHSWRTVPAQHRPYLPPSQLKQVALGGQKQTSTAYIYYFGEGRPAAVLVNVPKDGFTNFYINPYTGKLLHREIIKDNFFTVIEYIHLYLLLPPAIGQWVVGISVIIFVVLMITGVVLWWPKRKSDRKRSFTIKWGAKWKRVNYDLHNVLGFYATAIALILAITGLAIAFNSVDKGIYKITNLGKTYPQETYFPKSDSLHQTTSLKIPVIDKAIAVARKNSPKAQMFLLSDNIGKDEVINVTAYRTSLHYGSSDFYYFDRYSGKLLSFLPNSKKSLGMKINDLNYDIHVGQALGLTGKILAFLTSLICASLPVTGFIVWLGKRRKSKVKIKKSKHLTSKKSKLKSQNFVN